MERMAGVDAGYLYLETPTMHMHTLKVAVVRPTGDFDFAHLTEEVLGRLERLPPLQRRVLPSPLGLTHPLWIADGPVDPAHHLFHHDVTGGTPGLERLVGEVASTPLDRTRPLWEMHVCQPYDDGRVAIVTKMHHALADGGAANALLGNVVDGFADAVSVPEVRERPPSYRRQAWLAVRDGVRQLLGLPALLVRTVLALLSLVRRPRDPEVSLPRPVLDVPPTPFNGPLTAQRSFATTTLPLADLKSVQRAHGVTLNDVVLAVVGGAVRAYLDARGSLPGSSLLAGVPVGTDTTGSGRLGGNRVSTLFTTLATDEPDPLARLRRISRVTLEAKEVHAALGPDLLGAWSAYAPPVPLAAATRLYSRLRAAAHHPAPFNVVVSNVRGPAAPVRVAGAEMVDLFSVGPILEGIGLNVTAWSYVDRMNVSLLSCPDLVDDLDDLAALLPVALGELAEAGPVAG